MVVQLSGLLDGASADEQVIFHFERGHLQHAWERQHIYSPQGFWHDNKKRKKTEGLYLSLVNVKTCDVDSHNHLGQPKKVEYPSTENYQPTLVVSRQKLTGESAEFIEPSNEPLIRHRRTATTTIEEIHRSTVPNTPDFTRDTLQFNYKAYFGTHSGLGYVERNGIANLRQLVEKLQSMSEESLNKPFGRWMEHKLVIECVGYGDQQGQTVANNLSAAKFGQLKISLPPRTLLTTTNEKLWTTLGFVKDDLLFPSSSYTLLTDNIVKDIALDQASGFCNDDNEDPKIFLSKELFDLSAAYTPETPSKRFLFKFFSKSTVVSRKITIPSDLFIANHHLCAVTLLRRILNDITRQMNLHPGCLEVTGVTPTAVDRLVLKIKSSVATPNPTSSFPLTIVLHFSSKLLEVINISVANVDKTPRGDLKVQWQPDKGSLTILNPGTSSEYFDITSKSAALTRAFTDGETMSFDWKNLHQQEGFSRVAANPEEDPDLVAQQLEAKKNRQELLDLITTSDLEDRYIKSAALLLKLEQKEQKLRDETLAVLPELKTKLDAIKILLTSEKQKNSRDAMKLTKLTALKDQIDASGDSDDLGSLKSSINEALASSNTLLSAHETALAKIQEHLNTFETTDIVDAAAAKASSTQQVETVAAAIPQVAIVANPVPPRGNTFVVSSVNAGEEFCTTSTNFPSEYMLVVDEGEPLDYISNRGFCSILAYVKDSGKSIINTNTCLLRDPHNLAKLRVRILTPGMGEYKPAGDKKKIFVNLLVCLSASSSTN